MHEPPLLHSKEFVELLFHQPYTKVQFLVDAGLAKRKTAADYLNQIAESGVLQIKKVGRENLYLNSRLFEVFSK
jgi:hypothetical protein